MAYYFQYDKTRLKRRKGAAVMIYISHLLPDQEMAELIDAYHTGVESIEFSISENLDQRRKKIKEYKAWGNTYASLYR